VFEKVINRDVVIVSYDYRAKGNAKYYSQTFIVSHYAGDVAYIITDFLEKDKVII
jgi:myosin heavy subunit